MKKGLFMHSTLHVLMSMTLTSHDTFHFEQYLEILGIHLSYLSHHYLQYLSIDHIFQNHRQFFGGF